MTVGMSSNAVIDTHHAEHGIAWPPALAPFDVHLLALGIDEAVQAQAETTYAQIQDAGLEVLYDEWRESAGVKFAGADPIGCPVRVTVSRCSLWSDSLLFARSVYGAYPWARYHSTALRNASRAGVWGRPSSRTALLESKYSPLRERRTFSGVATGVRRGFNRAKATST